MSSLERPSRQTSGSCLPRAPERFSPVSRLSSCRRHGRRGIDPHCQRAIALRLCSERDLFPIQIRENREASYVVGGNFLHPDCLPDAALSGVVHAASLQLLLALGMVGGVAVILDAHSEQIFSGLVHGIRDIYGKGKIATLVAAHSMSVDVDFTPLIHRAEVEEITSRLLAGSSFRHFNIMGADLRKRSPVPEILPRLKLSVDARKEAFRGEGYKDFPIPAVGPGGAVCDGIVPGAVEDRKVLPTAERGSVLRENVFGSRFLPHRV